MTQAGDGPWSTTDTGTPAADTPNAAPPAPTLSDQSATSGAAFSYQFDAVTDPDGDDVAYSAALSDGSALSTVWLTFDPATRTFGGIPATGDVGMLTVTVTATDDGTPAQSASADFTITVAAAYVARQFRASPGSTRIRYTWAAPSAGDVGGYELRYGTDSTFPEASTTTVTPLATDTVRQVRFLTIDTTYYAQIRAKDSSGTFGPWSPTLKARTVSSIIDATPPSRITAPTVTAGDGQLVVTWTAPQYDYGNTVVEYDVRYIRSDASTSDKFNDDRWTEVHAVWKFGEDTALTYTLGGRTNGVSLDVQVRGVSSAGDGTWSLTTAGTPVAATPNNAPAFATDTATRSIPENTAADVNIGAPVAATDADTADVLTYTLGGTDANSFNIVSTSGQLQTKTGVTYDFETKASYAVTVNVEDGNGGSDSIAVTINLTNSAVTYAGSFTEAAANDGSVTGSVTATLAGDSFTSAVVSGDHVSASNVPDGLTAVLTRTSARVVTLTLTGTATNHANADNVSDLTITFADAAFANETAAQVTGSSKSNIAIDFTDALSIAYTGTLSEAAVNNGSMMGSIVATLTGDTFTSAVVSGNHVTASNVPAGLTASFARTSATVVTLTLTGTATNHAAANNISNLGISFADAAFENETAATVGGSSKSDIPVTFRDASSIAYAGTFTEAAANDGSVTGSVTATLTGDTFAPAASGTTAAGVMASNVPAGLTPVLTRTSDTVVTLTLTGTATSHANADDVSDLTITFVDDAFTNEAATTITGATKSDLAINFTDASSIAYTGTLSEAAVNNGSMTGSIVATLTGDTFTSNVVSADHVSASNVPAGLTASFARTSATVVTLTLTGTATNHASSNDISNLGISFADDAFENETAATVAGSSKSDIPVSFTDASSIAYTGTLSEAAVNNGSITGSIVATLTGDTFTSDVVSGNHVSPSNVPAGLTASFARTSATVVTLTLTGTATNHASSNDISNLGISFADDAFTNEAAATVGGSSKSDIPVTFLDASSIAYTGTLSEAAVNNGSMTGSIVATLTGDTFTNDVVSADHVSASNVPAGLTATFARTSDRVVTLTLTGTATNHASSNDISNLEITFGDGAFTNETAATVGGSSKSDIAVSFTDASSIAYTGNLSEAAVNNGSMTGSIVATLTGDTFTSDVVSGNHVSPSNVPAGLTASFARTSATVVTLTLTGTATNHASSNDISNLGISFADDAFTNEAAATVGGSSKSDIPVTFRDASGIAYTGTLSEAAVNDGSIAGSIVATLTGDTYAAAASGTTAAGVSASNVPAGLSAVLTRTSATVVTLTLTGTATAHANTDDISNLTITFTDAAFANEAAALVSGTSKSDIGIDFDDPSGIAYAGTFTEADDNDGSIAGSIVATLTGDTFATDVVSGDHVSATNVPAGLTASFSRTSNTKVTLTLTGNATSHANADDVNNLTITFADGAFENEAASRVTGATKTDIGVNFEDPSSIAYSGSFTEVAANDGSVTGSVTATLTGDTYAAAASGTTAAGVSASNVPSGLTAVLTRTSDTVVTLTLTGSATAHADSNDINNLTITFTNAAFANEAAALVTGATKTDIGVNFEDPSGIAYTGTLSEAAVNNGSITGSIVATLTGDTFTSNVVSANHVRASNVPAGLSASFARTSATVVTLTLTGTATNHASGNNISNLTITFANDAFTDESAATVGSSSKSDIPVTFRDPSGIAYTGTLSEAAVNNGSITGSIVATLTGDTFTSDVVSGNHVSASNVPAGLTASFARTSATVVTLTLTGMATNHASSNDISNLGITFGDGAFTNEAAATVGSSSKSDIAVSFTDPSGIAYTGTLSEAAANDGSIAGSIVATLTGDTFTSDVVSGNHVSASNVPAGLSASFARTSATVVTLTLTGTATNHASSHNISNLGISFADDAFTNEAAATVGSSSKSDIPVTFRDASSIAYTGTLSEAAANDGSVAGSIVATLTGDTFAATVVSGNHVRASNVPSGLTRELLPHQRHGGDADADRQRHVARQCRRRERPDNYLRRRSVRERGGLTCHRRDEERHRDQFRRSLQHRLQRQFHGSGGQRRFGDGERDRDAHRGHLRGRGQRHDGGRGEWPPTCLRV